MMHRLDAPRSIGSVPVVLLATLWAVAVPALAGAESGGGPTPYAYVVEADNDVLARHRLDDPGTLVTVATLQSPTQAFITGCETLPSSSTTTLYCIEGVVNESVLFTVDLLDGTVTPVGVATSQELTGFTELAADPTTGTLYAVASGISFSLLYTLDPTTGQETLVGGITNGAFITAAAFDGTGQLYAYEADTGSLMSIDKATGEGTVIGSTGFPSANNDALLDFADDGTCFYWRLNGTTGLFELLTCDPSTGAATLVGAVGDVSPGGTPRITAAAVVDFVFVDGFESGDTSEWSATVP